MLQDKDDQPKKQGSGFFIKPGIIATSLSLLDGVASGYCKVAGSRKRYKIEGIIARDTLNQVALLQTDRNAVPALNLSNDLVLTGDEATILSCPKGLNGEFRNGTISGIHSKGDNKFYEITSDILPSMNGGPVLSDGGKAIGMAASFVVEGRSYTIVVPSYAMTDLLSKTSSPSFQEIKTLGKSSENKQLGKGVVCDRLEGCMYLDWELKFRVTNNLNTVINSVKILIISRDTTGAVLTAKNFIIKERIEPGLALIVAQNISRELGQSLGLKRLYKPDKFVEITVPHEIRVLEVK